MRKERTYPELTEFALILLLCLRSEYDFVTLRFGNEVFLDLPADIRPCGGWLHALR